MFITARGNDHVMSTFSRSSSSSLSSEVLFIWWNLSWSGLLTGSFYWWSFMLLHEFINLHVSLVLIHVFCLTWWLRPMNVMLFEILAITGICYLQGLFYLICVWCVNWWFLSMNILHNPMRFMHPFVLHYQKNYLC